MKHIVVAGNRRLGLDYCLDNDLPHPDAKGPVDRIKTYIVTPENHFQLRGMVIYPPDKIHRAPMLHHGTPQQRDELENALRLMTRYWDK